MSRVRVDESLVPVTADLVATGLAPREIERFLREHHGSQAPKTGAQLAALLESAKVLLRQRADQYAASSDVIVIERLNLLFKKCVAAGDRRCALHVQRELNRLAPRGAGAAPDTQPARPGPYSFDDAYRRHAQQ